MRNLLPLTYGDLATYLASYPPDSPILLDFLSEPDDGPGYATAPHRVGQALNHCREMPRDGVPVIVTEHGPQIAIGMCFSDASPIVSLIRAEAG